MMLSDIPVCSETTTSPPTQEVATAHPVTSERPTQAWKQPASQRDDTTSSINIAGGVSGACALISVIIVVGSLIYCRRVGRRPCEFTIKRTAEDGKAQSA